MNVPKLMHRSRIAGLACGLGAATSPALAHEAWVQPGPGPRCPIEYGDFTSEAYPASKVQSVEAFDAEHRSLKTAVLPTVYGATLSV